MGINILISFKKEDFTFPRKCQGWHLPEISRANEAGVTVTVAAQFLNL